MPLGGGHQHQLLKIPSLRWISTTQTKMEVLLLRNKVFKTYYASMKEHSEGTRTLILPQMQHHCAGICCMRALTSLSHAGVQYLGAMVSFLSRMQKTVLKNNSGKRKKKKESWAYKGQKTAAGRCITAAFSLQAPQRFWYRS